MPEPRSSPECAVNGACTLYHNPTHSQNPNIQIMTVKITIKGKEMKLKVVADPHSFYTILNECPEEGLLGEKIKIAVKDGRGETSGRVVTGPIIIDGRHTDGQIIYVHSFPKTILGWKQLHDLDLMRAYTHKGFVTDIPPVVIKGNINPKEFPETYLRKCLLPGASRVIASWVRNGLIEQCDSVSNASVQLRTKPNGNVLICFHYKSLNSCSEKDPPHLREDRSRTIESITLGKYYSILKLFYGEFHVPLDTFTKYKTAFTFLGSRYVWNRLPGDFVNKNKRLCDALEKVLDNLPHDMIKRVTFYVDVILISAETKTDCEKFTDKLQRHLEDNSFEIRNAQSQICKSQVSFIGREICQDGVRLGKGFIKKVRNMMSPQNADDLSSILGHLNDANHHTPGFGIFANRLRESIGKDNEFWWNDVYEDMLDRLKVQILENRPLVPGLATDEACTVQIFVNDRNWMATILNGAGKTYHYESGVLPALKTKENFATRELKAMKEVWEKNKRVLESRDMVWEVESPEIALHKDDPVTITNKKQLKLDFLEAPGCRIKVVPSCGRNPPDPWP